jgi:phospholipase/carboxylesterase
MPVDLDFAHIFQPPSASRGPVTQSAALTLLMLHGTGGNEHDLLPLAKMLAPGAAVLSPRGKVLERGMPRFFRRLAEGVFDIEDLRQRTHELADFIGTAATRYGFDPRRVVAVGFSNGANIAASTLLLRPEVLGGAILFRAMVPLVPERLPSIPDMPVLMSSGRHDPLVAPENSERLAAMLREAGANLTLHWQSAGHDLTDEDVTLAARWLRLTSRS